MLTSLLLTLSLCTQDTVALTDFRLLDIEVGRILEHQTVLVADGRIYEVGPAASTRVPKSARRIGGVGRTLVPGLVDVHTHVDPSDYGLFLANGVTAIRELNGTPRHLAWRDSVESGALLGPRLLVASPLLTGKAIPWARHELLLSPEKAAARARELVAQGYDFAKVYDDLPREVYEALTTSARELGLPTVGHIPSEVGLEAALDAGQALEHAEKIVMDVLGHELADLSRLSGAAEQIAASGVPVTPTLASQEALNGRHVPGFERRFEAPEVTFVDSATLAWWMSLRRARAPRTVEGELWPERFLRAQRMLVRELAERGVPLLLGSDTPNPLMVPGFSVHEELAALVRAGLSPLAAWQTGTLVAGGILAFEPPIGRIAPGYAADLLAVSGDPLLDLGILRRPEGVMASGRWLDQAQLDALLSQHPTQRGSP